MSALSRVSASVAVACGYLGTLTKSVGPLVTLENLCESLALVGCSKVLFESLGSEATLLLIATLGTAKMLPIAAQNLATALPSPIDLKKMFPQVLGDTRFPSVLGNVCTAGAVSAVSASMTSDPMFTAAPGGAVLVGAGSAFLLKKAWDKCCGSKPAAAAGAGAGGPAA
jgi:hypothetical protein